MTAAPKALVERFLTALNDRDIPGLGGLLAPECRVSALDGLGSRCI